MSVVFGDVFLDGIENVFGDVFGSADTLAPILHPHLTGYTITYGGTVNLAPIAVDTTLSLSLQLHNHGTADLNVGDVTAEPPAEVMGGIAGAISPGNLGAAIPIDVTPTVLGEFSSEVSISSDDPTHPVYVFTLAGVAFDPDAVQTPSIDEVWRAPRRLRVWRIRAMRPANTHNAINQLDGYSFGNATYFVDLSAILGDRTISSASLQEQSNDAEAEELTVSNVAALVTDTTLYGENSEPLWTIPTGKGFSCKITGGGAGLYELAFKWTESNGDIDALTCQYLVKA